MKHAILFLAATMVVCARARPAGADDTAAVPSAGDPVFGRAKLASIGDVQARSRAVAGTARPVDAPTSGTTIIVSAGPRRRASSSVGARETSELLAHHRGELAACLAGDTDPAGVVLVKAHVGADGKTVSADVASFSGVASSVASCLAAATAKVTFESHGPRAALVPLRLHVSEVQKEVQKTEEASAPPTSNASPANDAVSNDPRPGASNASH